MSAKIGIGITTYQDIRSAEIGRRVFEAYQSAAPRAVPNQVLVWSEKYLVDSPEEFSARWLTRIPFEVRDHRTKEIIERGEHQVGANWRRTKPIRGQGSASFGTKETAADTSELVIEHNYSKDIDWIGLFEQLIEIAQPSYGMLHLFTDAEIARTAGNDRYDKFVGPFAGETHFTSWRSSLGEWRKPDPWEVKERRAYRHLPELSWANFLGPQFDGEFDRDRLTSSGAIVRAVDAPGILFTVTEDIAAVSDTPTQFGAGRSLLRESFGPGFFRVRADA